MTQNLILLLNVAATWSMVGLIWFVQLIHYPLFALVGAPEFTRYEAHHTRRTAWLVAVFMPVEAVTAAWLVVTPPDGANRELAIIGVIVVAALWLTTGAWQAPLHGRLSEGFDPDLHDRLVRSNWLRTVLWSIRGVLVLILVSQTLG